MSAAPSIAMIAVLAMLSFFGAMILSRPWQRWIAFGCGIFEVAAVIFLLVEVHR